MMPGAGGDVNTTLPLILGIVQAVLCCNLLFGGAGIALAVIGGNSLKAGNIEDARGKVKMAFIVMGIGVVLQILGSILYAVVVGVAGAAAQ
jgi:hypothetical protein